jgi:hypothetical protein
LLLNDSNNYHKLAKLLGVTTRIDVLHRDPALTDSAARPLAEQRDRQQYEKLRLIRAVFRGQPDPGHFAGDEYAVSKSGRRRPYQQLNTALIPSSALLRVSKDAAGAGGHLSRPRFAAPQDEDDMCGKPSLRGAKRRSHPALAFVASGLLRCAGNDANIYGLSG